MQGWTPDFIPKLTGDAVDMKLVDTLYQIANADALRCSRELAAKEGIFVGITSGGTFRRRPQDRGRSANKARTSS
jgi:cysteine synthase A